MAASRLRSALMSLSLWVLIALLAGLFAGAAAQAWGLPGGEGTAEVIAAVGSLWLNALKMTIIPLVFSLLVTGIASIADAAATGRLALKALMVFALLLVGATAWAIFAAESLHAIWPIAADGARTLLAGAPDAAPPFLLERRRPPRRPACCWPWLWRTRWRPAPRWQGSAAGPACSSMRAEHAQPRSSTSSAWDYRARARDRVPRRSTAHGECASPWSERSQAQPRRRRAWPSSQRDPTAGDTRGPPRLLSAAPASAAAAHRAAAFAPLLFQLRAAGASGSGRVEELLQWDTLRQPVDARAFSRRSAWKTV